MGRSLNRGTPKSVRRETPNDVLSLLGVLDSIGSTLHVNIYFMCVGGKWGQGTRVHRDKAYKANLHSKEYTPCAVPCNGHGLQGFV